MDLFDPRLTAATTAGQWLREARDQLEKAGVETAALDARLLLIDGLGIPHSVFISDPNLSLQPGEMLQLESMLHRRLQREPVSRILGWREFYGRRFAIDQHVLDPRSDTETLIAAALAAGGEEQELRFLDIGTGSGCIAVTLLAERREWTGSATDINAAALRVVGKNAETHRVAGRLELHNTSWARGVAGPFDLIVSNPPYIPSGELAGLMPEVANFDPQIALDGDQDGLAAYRSILASAPGLLAPGGCLIVEVGARQADSVYALATESPLERFRPPEVSLHDLAGNERIAVFRMAG